ncbi:MAG: DUF3109 family protein [Tannerella sp.]|jgi:hypothetical protein|nr:DUF3109 family protein [Tannerella sp.]
MIEIFDTIISRDLAERYFHCDLPHCKGRCCVEGDAGAPLEKAEFNILRKILPVIWNDLSPDAQRVINAQGVACIDREGETVTSIVNGKDCVFTCYDENAVCRCAIEKAYYEGKTDFLKPVSCHLYPVRVKQYKYYKAVNYDKWNICKAGELLGKLKQVPLYQFLKEPLIRKFGSEWYNALDECVKTMVKPKISKDRI